MSNQPSRTVPPRRLFMSAPSVAAVLVLLVGSVLPPIPSQRSEAVREATMPTAERAPAFEPPASVTDVPQPEPVPPAPAAQSADGRAALPMSGQFSVPDVLLAAYRQAVAGAPPACHLPVSLLAAIGQVESGSLAGRSLDAAHRAVPPVLGPVLDGVGTAAIRDTDGGRLDGNPRWDRAVGPMQFIPGTWAAFGVDGDGDGRADPQDVYDAAASAAGYLCAGGRDLALSSGLQSAILSYNHSTPYLATVLAWQQRFTASGARTGQAVIGTINTPTNAPARATDQVRAATNTPITPITPSTPRTPITPSTDVVVHTAAKLALTTAPSPTATSGTTLATQPVVAVQDTAGNTTTTDTSSVTLTLTTSDGATLTCASNPTVATSGIARFTGCSIDKAGTYTLTATDGSLAAAISSSVTIFAGAPAAVSVVLGSAQSATVGHEFTSPLVARVTDANANPVPGATLTFSAPSAGASGTFANTTTTAAALTGANGRATSSVVTANTTTTTTALTDGDGRATSSLLTANTTAGTYSLTATAGSVSATFTLTNSPGAAATFAITSAPVSGPASGTATLGPITVQLQDSYGNPAAAPTGGTEVTLSSDSAGTPVFATTLAGASVTSLIIPSGESSATFYYGDTKPGSPVITASGPRISAIQKVTITAPGTTTKAAAVPRGP